MGGWVGGWAGGRVDGWRGDDQEKQQQETNQQTNHDKKKHQQDSFSKKYAPPSHDENAPDLYLPLMSFITYVVLTSYVKGTNGKFTPEVLSQVSVTCV
jgi:hypothetical protein